MSTGFIKSCLWDLNYITQDVARHGKSVDGDPRLRYVSYWHSKGYGTVSGRCCCKCQDDLKRFPVYDGERSLCASCMEKDGNYAKKTA